MTRQHFPDFSPVYRGHGRKIKVGIRSTRTTAEEGHNVIDGEKALFTATYNLKDELDRKLYSDQTGKFPVTSYTGNQYIMVAYGMEISNAILVEPMKNRSAGEMAKAHNAIAKKLHENNTKPSLMILDNECSQDMKQAFKLNEMRFQLVPPQDHRRNAAEK